MLLFTGLDLLPAVFHNLEQLSAAFAPQGHSQHRVLGVFNPGIPIRITPISPASKIARTCSRLAIRGRSASSTKMSVVGPLNRKDAGWEAASGLTNGLRGGQIGRDRSPAGLP